MICNLARIPVGLRKSAMVKRPRHTAFQIAFALRQAEAGAPPVQVCRIVGISETILTRWQRKYSGLTPSELHRLRRLEDENRELRRILDRLVPDPAERKAIKQKLTARGPVQPSTGIPHAGNGLPFVSGRNSAAAKPRM